MQLGIILILALILACFVLVRSSSPWKRGDHPPSSIMELCQDGLRLMEPAIVPETGNGGRWWYAPSRRAQLHAQRTKSQLRRNLSLLNEANEDWRLPGDILPYTYTIRLLPFIEEGNFTINGHIEIFIDCIRDTKNISMNSIDITFNKASFAVTITFHSTEWHFLMYNSTIGCRFSYHRFFGNRQFLRWTEHSWNHHHSNSPNTDSRKTLQDFNGFCLNTQQWNAGLLSCFLCG